MDFKSSVVAQGNPIAPDYVYYNADIINNNTTDQAEGNAVQDPQIRFNETRDTALIKNVQDYYFSIVRFTMDGPNRDLPLFIPVIQNSTGANNVNLTPYAVAISYQQSWNTTDVGILTPTITPVPRFLQYNPETQNPFSAPTPKPVCSPDYQGIYNAALVYQVGQIVALANDIYGNGISPFYKVSKPTEQWNPLITYGTTSWVYYNNIAYFATAPAAVGVPPPLAPGVWQVGISGIAPPTIGYWEVAPNNLGSPQDLSSRYYWVYTYNWWMLLVNNLLDEAYQDTYNQFQLFWGASGTADPFPFPTYQDFKNYVNVPKMVYDRDSRRFKIFYDSDGYGDRLQAFTPTPAGNPIPAQTPPSMKLWFNSNMFGLFANFFNVYYNRIDPIPVFGTANLYYDGAPQTTLPVGYVNLVNPHNEFYQNVVDYRIAPYAGVPPLGYVPPNGFSGPTVVEQKPYWVNEQDFPSNDSLWSPISSIVFTSTLLPVRAEATGQPVVLGSGNIGFSSKTSQSAFQPIITDISLDTSSNGAEAYKQFIYYAPTAEYRLSDFTSSKQDIRNIDIQVYWKNRLDNNLYPINMFNCSSVSLKVMFRHKDAHTGNKL